MIHELSQFEKKSSINHLIINCHLMNYLTGFIEILKIENELIVMLDII